MEVGPGSGKKFSTLQSFEEVGEFVAGAVVMLGDGELERVFEDGFGFGGAIEGHEAFAELDMRDHPIRLRAAERVEMFDGIRELAGIAICLGEIETGQVVVGESLPKFERSGDSVVAHRSSSS